MRGAGGGQTKVTYHPYGKDVAGPSWVGRVWQGGRRWAEVCAGPWPGSGFPRMFNALAEALGQSVLFPRKQHTARWPQPGTRRE